MKKKGSLGDCAISEFCLAVYPLSLVLPSPPSNKLTFYFQKNLQIISKAQAPNHYNQQKGTISFSPPTSIQHFRTQSQKNLDYQFSLYLGNDQTQQLVETQKVNLEHVWTDYRLKKQTLHQNSVKFNKIQATLHYLITIAHNNTTLLDHLQQYYNNNRHSLTTASPPIPPSAQKHTPDNNNQTPTAEIQNPSSTDKNRHEQIAESSKISDFSNESPKKNQQQENKEPISVNEIIPELPLNFNRQNQQNALQLTSSQRQLGNTIDIDVEQSQPKQPAALQKLQQLHEQTELIPTKNIDTENVDPPITPTFPIVNSATSSSPKKIRYAVLILIILVLLGGGLLVSHKYNILPSSLTKQKTEKVSKNKNKNKK